MQKQLEKGKAAGFGRESGAGRLCHKSGKRI